MKKINILLLFLLCAVLSLQAQNRRYIDQVFTEVEVETDIIYGVNATALALQVVGQAIPEALRLDVYQPVGDTENERPVVLVFHTGNFLPFPQNGGTGGTRKDSTVVEVCTRLAKMGYVSAAVSYRLGWNPIAPNQSDRIFGIINAAYRGVQDARTAVRFMKRSVAEESNPFGVDSTRVTLWGIGTGGYITLATASLDEYNKVLLPKFIANIGGTPFPMVNEPINGDIYGTSVGVVPPGIPYPFPAGDTLCYPNHVDYSSDYQLSVNMGGAMGDTLWMDAGQVPIVSFHVPTDPFAPYECAVLNVPPPVNLPVVDVCGSGAVATKQTRLGNNAMWESADFIDPISEAMRARNGGREGLAPLPRLDPTESSPWDFYAPDNPGAVTAGPPDPVRARLYMDTIMAYFAPRACIALNLGCDLMGISSTRKVLSARDVQLQMMPNPAYEQVRIQTSLEHPILDVQVFDLSGRMVKSAINLKDSNHTIYRGNLPNGMYVVKMRFAQGIITEKLIFN